MKSVFSSLDWEIKIVSWFYGTQNVIEADRVVQGNDVQRKETGMTLTRLSAIWNRQPRKREKKKQP